jgi:hypothetical protein
MLPIKLLADASWWIHFPEQVRPLPFSVLCMIITPGATGAEAGKTDSRQVLMMLLI